MSDLYRNKSGDDYRLSEADPQNLEEMKRWVSEEFRRVEAALTLRPIPSHASMARTTDLVLALSSTATVVQPYLTGFSISPLIDISVAGGTITIGKGGEGVYQVNVGANMELTANATITAFLHVNGSPAVSTAFPVSGAPRDLVISPTLVQKFSPGDVVDFRLASSVANTATIKGCSFSMHRIG